MLPQTRRRSYNQYHSSLKLYIAAGGNTALACDAGVPPSTIASWKRSDFSSIITNPLAGSSKSELALFQQFIEHRGAQRLFAAYLNIAKTIHALLRSIQGWEGALVAAKDSILDTIANVKSIIGLERTLKLFHLPRRKYDAWRKNTKCLSSLIGSCVMIHPLQATRLEVDRLKSFLTGHAPLRWPLVSFYYLALRNNVVAFSLSTFYKYARLLGFSVHSPHHRRKHHSTGLRSDKPDQFWHADVTIYRPANNVKVYIYFVIDNYSRYILAWRASLELTAKTRFDTVIEAYRKFIHAKPVNPVNVVVDDGTENKLIPLNPTDDLSLRKIIAQQDIVFSNSMIESVNKQIKYQYLFQKDLPDFNATVAHLERSIPDFNNLRPYAPLHGLTPEEVYLKRMIPDKHAFQKQLTVARELRHRENISHPCPICDETTKTKP